MMPNKCTEGNLIIIQRENEWRWGGGAERKLLNSKYKAAINTLG